MATTKRKAVFTAEPAQLERIRELVESGRCNSGRAAEDLDLVDLQAFDRRD